ncbi:MAG: ankyrin repeat domain-containing protein [Candidatus Babeliales bacterium]
MKHGNFLYVVISLLCATASLHGAKLDPEKQSKNGSIHQACFICQGRETEQLDFAFLLPCGHMLHRDCLTRLVINEGKACPACGNWFIDRVVGITNPFDQDELVLICKGSLINGYPGVADSVLRMGLLNKLGLSHLLHSVAFYLEDCKLAIKLIEAGADVNHQRGTYGTTALYEAVSSRKQDLVTILLQAGADPNIPCKIDGCAPLDYVRCIDNWDIAKLLLGAGARHAKYSSYISWAVKKNSFEILDTLLKVHVPLNNENFAELWEDHCKIAESDRDGRIGAFILQHSDQPQK